MMDLNSLEIFKKKNVYIIYDDPVKEINPEEKQKIIDWYDQIKPFLKNEYLSEYMISSQGNKSNETSNR